jgi:hypothetical protein
MRALVLVLLLINLGCDQKKSPEELTGEMNEIYGLIFDVTATRADTSLPWYFVQGKQSMVFEAGDTPTSGSVFHAYLDYREPQFCALGQSCNCTGTVQSTFLVSESDQDTTNDNAKDPSYSIFDPYTPPSPTNTQNANGEEVYSVYNYQVGLTPIANDLTAECRSHVNRGIKIIRYYSGELIIEDGYRHLLLRPRSSSNN